MPRRLDKGRPIPEGKADYSKLMDELGELLVEVRHGALRAAIDGPVIGQPRRNR